MSTPAPIVNKRTNPLLAQYVLQLATHPLRTKAATSATLLFVQEVLSSHLAGVRPSKPAKDATPMARSLAAVHINAKALKMAAYGALISAPLSHYLSGALQRIFAGKTSRRAKAAYILCNNTFVAPIQTVVYLASIAIINGARSFEDIKRTVKNGFMTMIRITWVASPLTMEIARKYVPVELWVPFFSIAQFVIGTYFATKGKRRGIAAAKKAEEERKKLEKTLEEQPPA
jgi:hypothetical protein